jgi:hypothetical protein
MEKVNRIDNQRPIFLFLLQHGEYKIGQRRRILNYWLLLFIDYVVEQATDIVIDEGRLQSGHGIQSDPHTPNITAVIVPFISDYLRRHRQGSANNLGRLDVILMI